MTTRYQFEMRSDFGGRNPLELIQVTIVVLNRDRLDEIARYALERAYHLPFALRAGRALYCSKAGVK
jgi:hypothetical protein